MTRNETHFRFALTLLMAGGFLLCTALSMCAIHLPAYPSPPSAALFPKTASVQHRQRVKAAIEANLNQTAKTHE